MCTIIILVVQSPDERKKLQRIRDALASGDPPLNILKSLAIEKHGLVDGKRFNRCEYIFEC